MQQEKTDQDPPTVEVSLAVIYKLADKLALIPRFPQRLEMIEDVADWLVDLCQGAELDGQQWTPEEQAAWLVETTLNNFDNWDEAQGLPAMRALFLRKFKPPPAQVEYETLPAPEIDCTICNDNGTVEVDGRIYWCTCDQACLLREGAPNLVIIMNRPRERREADLARRLQIEAEITRHLAARKRKQDAETNQTGTSEVPALRRRGLFAMLKDRAGRILRTRVS